MQHILKKLSGMIVFWPKSPYPLKQIANNSQNSQPLRCCPVQSSRIPILVNAKSYFTGSVGSISEKLSVIFIAVDKETVLRSWNPKILHNLAICTSTGTMSLSLSTDFHKPTSTSSSRTIHRRKRLSRLQTLPPVGLANKYFKPRLI